MTQTKTSELPRVLGPWLALAVVVGTVIGTGVFKKAAAVARDAPEFGVAMSVWILVGLLALCGALAYAEVNVRFPKAGGNYVFLREAYGRGMGFLSGWVDFWIVKSASIAALAAMFTESLQNIFQLIVPEFAGRFDYWPQQFFTVGLIAVLAFVNARGTLLGARLQFGLTILKVSSIIGLALLPILALVFGFAPDSGPRAANLQPIWPESFPSSRWVGYGSAMIAVLWAYHGWMNLGPIAEEVKNPQKNLPLGVIGGVLVLIALYLSANIAYSTVLPAGELIAATDGTTVARDFCIKLLGSAGGLIASLIVMTSVFGSLNGNILVGPRLPYAMAQDGLAPGALARLHPKYRTPIWATVLLAGWSALMVLILGTLVKLSPNLFAIWKQDDAGAWQFAIDSKGNQVFDSPFDMLTDFAIFGSITFDTLAVVALFVFRRKHAAITPTLPYRCPGYPLVPALYLLGQAFVLVSMFLAADKRWKGMVGLGFIAVGAVVYWVLFGRKSRSGK